MNVGFCRLDQIEDVMDFIGEYWAKNHILSTSRQLVDWQHLDTSNNRYNFVVGSDAEGAVYGILGFIPTSHFDATLRREDTVWLTSWKVREGDAPAGLGLRLHAFLERNVPHRMMGTVGNNEHAARIYRALGYTTGTMTQFYTLNQRLAAFTLCEVPEDIDPADSPRASANSVTLMKVGEDELLRQASQLNLEPPSDRLPHKSAQYFVQRFLRHPIYKYDIYAVSDEDCLAGWMVVRCAEANGARCLRVVDWHGRPAGVSLSEATWQRLLSEYDAEYLDMFCCGDWEQTLRDSGMRELDPAGEVVIPNHFEPFVKQNVVIRWAYKAPPGTQIQVFKADADQDRPNRVTTVSETLAE